jgi:hypothetical protein
MQTEISQMNPGTRMNVRIFTAFLQAREINSFAFYLSRHRCGRYMNRSSVGATSGLGPRGDIAPHHSITSSAATCTDNGTVRPSAFAVLRLRTNWNFVGRTTGRSAGFSPFKIRPDVAAKNRTHRQFVRRKLMSEKHTA